MNLQAAARVPMLMSCTRKLPVIISDNSFALPKLLPNDLAFYKLPSIFQNSIIVHFFTKLTSKFVIFFNKFAIFYGFQYNAWKSSGLCSYSALLTQCFNSSLYIMHFQVKQLLLLLLKICCALIRALFISLYWFKSWSKDIVSQNHFQTCLVQHPSIGFSNSWLLRASPSALHTHAHFRSRSL